MNRNGSRRPIVDTLFLLALFGVFTICLLFVVLFGAKIYRKIVDDTETNFSARTAQAYVLEKLHQQDTELLPEIQDFSDGNSCLKLSQKVGEATYHTYLYISDHKLKELTVSSKDAFLPDAGNEILPMEGLSVQAVNPNLFRFTLTEENGKEQTFFAAVRSNAGGGEHE